MDHAVSDTGPLLMSPQVGNWPERKKTVVAESERFVAIQSHGFPKSPSPIVSGLVIGYCTAEAYDRRGLYKFLRKRYGKKRGRVVMHPLAICLQLFDDELSRQKAQNQAESPIVASSSALHIPLVFLGDGSLSNSPTSGQSESSLLYSGTRYGTFDPTRDWPEVQISNDNSWGVRKTKSVETGYKQTLPKEVYFFNYGVTVYWGLSQETQKKILSELQQFEIGRLAADDIDVDSFEVIADASCLPNICNDIITLESIKRDKVRLAISLAVSQSTKLGVEEDMVLQTVDRYKHLTATLAHTGSISLSRQETNMVIGEVYTLISSVNFSSFLLDLPSFFWDSDDSAEALYNSLHNYLQINRRLKILERRIVTLTSIVGYLKSELSAKGYYRLDWLVIAALGLGAIIQLLNTYMKIAWAEDTRESDFR